MVDKKRDIKTKSSVKEKNRRIERNRKQRQDIAKKEHIKNTVNITKILIKIFIFLLIVFGSIYITCRYIGTAGLIIKEYSIDYDNLPETFYGLKLIQISDVNYNKKTMPIDKIKKTIEKINSLKPDIIVFTGNLVYGEISQKELKQLEEIFSTLEAEIGKYAVFGDDDTSSRILIKNAGFVDIENNYDLIYQNNHEPILITGISDSNPDIKNSFSYFEEENSNNEIFTISLVHKPDKAIDILNERDANIILAGCSLGGQIYIPNVGGLFKIDGATNYVDSYYKINDTDLYISSGIGTRKYPYRLFNHPSINLFRLK